MRDATRKIPAKIQRLQQSAFHRNRHCNNFGSLVNQNNWEFRVQFSILRWERLRDAIQKIPTKIQLDVANNVWINFLCKNLPTSTQIGPSKSKAQIQSKIRSQSGPNQSRVEKKAELSCLIYSNPHCNQYQIKTIERDWCDVLFYPMQSWAASNQYRKKQNQ